MDDKVIEPDGKTQTVRHIARSGGAVANARKRAREAAVLAKQSRAQVAVALLLSLWLAACRRANRTPIRPDDGKGPASRCVVTTATGPMHASLLDVAAAGADGLFFATLPDGASSSTEAEIFYAALAGAPERKGKGQLDCSYLPCLVHTAEGLYVSAWTDELPVVLRFRDAWECYRAAWLMDPMPTSRQLRDAPRSPSRPGSFACVSRQAHGSSGGHFRQPHGATFRQGHGATPQVGGPVFARVMGPALARVMGPPSLT